MISKKKKPSKKKKKKRKRYKSFLQGRQLTHKIKNHLITTMNKIRQIHQKRQQFSKLHLILSLLRFKRMQSPKKHQSRIELPLSLKTSHKFQKWRNSQTVCCRNKISSIKLANTVVTLLNNLFSVLIKSSAFVCS